jgi:hypothetical protein
MASARLFAAVGSAQQGTATAGFCFAGPDVNVRELRGKGGRMNQVKGHSLEQSVKERETQ